MMHTVIATFENGVLKPAQPLALPENSKVRIIIEPLDWEANREERLAALERLLSLAKAHTGEHLTRDQLHERR